MLNRLRWWLLSKLLPKTHYIKEYEVEPKRPPMTKEQLAELYSQLSTNMPLLDLLEQKKDTEFKIETSKL